MPPACRRPRPGLREYTSRRSDAAGVGRGGVAARDQAPTGPGRARTTPPAGPAGLRRRARFVRVAQHLRGLLRRCTLRRVIGDDSPRLAPREHPDRRIPVAVPARPRFVHQTKHASTNGTTGAPRRRRSARWMQCRLTNRPRSIRHADRSGARRRDRARRDPRFDTAKLGGRRRRSRWRHARASSATAGRTRRRAPAQMTYPRSRPSSKRKVRVARGPRCAGRRPGRPGAPARATTRRGRACRGSGRAGLRRDPAPRSSPPPLRSRRGRWEGSIGIWPRWTPPRPDVNELM